VPRFAAAISLLVLVLAGCRNPTVVEYEPYESPGKVEPGDANPADVDSHYHLQWHLQSIRMPGAWGILQDPSLQSSFDSVTVAVLDNGIRPDTDISDIYANLFIDGTSPDGGYDFFGDDDDPREVASADSHGSHVAGTIAAETGSGSGVAGIGWNRLTVMPVRALGPSSGNTGDLADAIYYSAQSPDGGVAPPSRRSSVINLSLGGGASDMVLYDAIDYAVGQGITVVAAAGNDGGSVIYPAAFDNTIAVSATDINDELSYYSNRGTAVDFSAPGGDTRVDKNSDGYPDGVLSTIGTDSMTESYEPQDGFGFYQGTSMATPHVSGVVGLLYSYAPGLNQDAVYAVLANTAKDLGEPGHDEKFGHGLIDAEAALEYLINAGRDYPVQPRTLGGGGSSSGEVSAAAVSSLAAEGAGRSRGRKPPQRRGAILPEAGAELEPGSVIVKLTEDAHGRRGAAAARSLADGVGGTAVRAVGGRLYRLGLPAGTAVEDAIRALGTHGDVEYAQPNYRYRIIE
jgi:subtilisin family serine protease